MSLPEFLLARIAEDEAVVKRAVRWSEGCTDWADDGEPDWEHIARHDPARVLAECDAKRRLVERCRQAQVDANAHFSIEDGQEELADDILAALAAVYADHPDFKPEWRV